MVDTFVKNLPPQDFINYILFVRSLDNIVSSKTDVLVSSEVKEHWTIIN